MSTGKNNPSHAGTVLTGWHNIQGQLYRFDQAGKLIISAGPSHPSPAWVDALREAKNTDQLLITAATGTLAVVSLHIRDCTGTWYETMNVQGAIGSKGLGKQKEGDKKTPVGIFRFTDAFGIREDPGSVIPYVRVDDSWWWVGDADSAHYNRFVSTRDTLRDWADGTSEHIITFGSVYHYVLALNYNTERIPHAGSAIFLHCLRSPGSPTAGCIAIPEENMVQVLRTVDKTCSVIIDSPDKIQNY